jgi:hypothetical protein
MELTPSETKHAQEVSYDMDLMIMAREYVGMDDGVPSKDVIEAVHQKYPGGITQFYLNNRF